MPLVFMLLRFKMKTYFPLLLSMLLTTETTAVYATAGTNSEMDSKEVSSYSNETTLAYDASENVKQKILLSMLQTSGLHGSSQTSQHQMSYGSETTQSFQEHQHQNSNVTEATQSSHKPQHQMSYATETTHSPQEHQHQMSNVTEATQTSENLNVNITSLESCRQKCGKIIEMPCSCDLKCLIHNNCCEDMAPECPDILEQSYANYGHMLKSTVECIQTGIFIISGCPGQSLSSNTSQNNTSSQKSTEKRIIKASTNISIRRQDAESSNFLLTILKTTLVSDLSTGFVYKNWDTYLCHANERSQPLLWHAEYATKYFIDLDGVKDQSSYLEIPPRYIPPAQLNESIQASRCIPNIVAKCRPDIALVHPELLLKCSSFISYTTVVNMTSKYYINKYCALCSHNLSEITPTDPVSYYKPIRTDFQFSLLVSISQGTFKLTSYGSNPLPWLHSICSIGDSPEQQAMSCQSEGCNTQFEQQPDGTCKELFSMTLAVAADTCPIRSEDIKALPGFFQCYLTTHLGLDIKEVKGPTTVAFDETLRQMLYINTVLLYGEAATILVTTNFFLRIGKSLSQMARALKYYRRRICAPEQSLNGKSYTQSLNSTGITTKLISNKENLLYKENVNKTSMSTMCAFSKRFNKQLLSQSQELFCVQDYTNDTMLDNFTSPCFQVFANEGKLMTSSCLFLIINLVCIFVIFKVTQVLI